MSYTEDILMKKPLFLLSVAAALLVEGASLDEYKWLASATEGDFNDPANWAKKSDALYDYPQAGCLSYLSTRRRYRVRR